MAGVAVYGVATLGFALSTALWLSLATLALAGAADMISIVVRQSLVQLETPDPMRGRVSAVNSLFIGASNQLGEFRAGAAAALVGAPAAAAAGALATLLVVAAWWRLFPALATRDRLVDHRPPEPREPSPTSR
jgi:MFS family permease